MTNKDKALLKAWNEFLEKECNCYADEFDNRPCDNGAICDKCLTAEKEKEFREKYLTNLK